MQERTHKQYDNMERFEDTYGVISVIFNSSGHILVGTENLNKHHSGRESGQISVPMETLKPFERVNRQALLLASLSELITAENVQILASGLCHAGIEGPLTLNERGLKGAVSIFSWQGDPSCMPFAPSNPVEYCDLQWLDSTCFIESAQSRPYAVMGVEFALDKGYGPLSPAEPFVSLRTLKPNQYTSIRNSRSDVE